MIGMTGFLTVNIALKTTINPNSLYYTRGETYNFILIPPSFPDFPSLGEG